MKYHGIEDLRLILIQAQGFGSPELQRNVTEWCWKGAKRRCIVGLMVMRFKEEGGCFLVFLLNSRDLDKSLFLGPTSAQVAATVVVGLERHFWLKGL